MKLKEAKLIYESSQSLKGLGAGSFGSAYLTTCGKVLKIGGFGDPTGAWIEDACRHFLTWGKPLRYAPKVYAFQTAPERGEWWAIMEYIEPEAARTDKAPWEAAAPVHVCEALLDWAEERGLQEEEGYCFPDCHGGNWGRAKDGRIVMFDPFAGLYGPDVYDVPARLPKVPKPHIIAALNKGPMVGRWGRG